MEFNFKKFIDIEFPGAYTPGSNFDERRIDCINPDCPKPAKHMFVNVAKGKFICHRCGFAGDYKAFLCLYYGLSFEEVLNNYEALYGVEGNDYDFVRKSSEQLITRINSNYKDSVTSFIIDLPRCYERIVGSTLPKFLVDRQVSLRAVKKFKMGICRTGFYKNRLIIPISTGKSKSYLAYSMFPKRVLKRYKELSEKYPENKRFDRNKKKILNPKSSLSNLLLFNYNNISTNCRIFVVEGVFDAIRLWMFGYDAVAIFGSYLNNTQRTLLLNKEPSEIVFMLDGDVWDSSDKFSLVNKAVEKTLKYYDGIVSIVKLASGIDPDDIRSKEVFKKYIASRRVVGGDIFASIYNKLGVLSYFK